MELDDFKKRKKDPTVVDPNHTEINRKADELITIFKSYDEKQKRISVAFMVINFSFGAIYFTNLARQTGIVQLGYFIGGIGFIAAAVYIYLRYKPLPPSCYSLPLTEFLARAEKKLRFFNPADYVIISVLLAVFGTGGGLIFVGLLHKYTDKTVMLSAIWIIFYICLVVFAFWAGLKNWKKEYGSLLQRIDEMRSLNIDQDSI
jgi:hypothetical protein